MKKYKQNDNFFHIPNEINSYWAGFIAADGCISDKNNLSIILSMIDKIHLQKLCKKINSNRIIKSYSFQPKNKPLIKASSFYIYGCKSICNDLKNNFNITPRKSLTLKPPYLYDEKLQRSFIRGYIDGDGSIYFSKQKGRNINRWGISIVGTNDVLTWINNCIFKYTGLTSNLLPLNKKSKYSFKLHYRGRPIKNILDWLYKNSNKNVRLNRKYNKYKEFLLEYNLSNQIGIYWKKDHNKWQSRIYINGKQIHIGYFDNKYDARLAYDKYAKKAFGIHTRLNFGA